MISAGSGTDTGGLAIAAAVPIAQDPRYGSASPNRAASAKHR
jgi:hypothetical protein